MFGYCESFIEVLLIDNLVMLLSYLGWYKSVVFFFFFLNFVFCVTNLFS